MDTNKPMPSRIILRLSLCFSTISDELSIHFILILTNNCIYTISLNNTHFAHPDFTISYSTQNACILLIISMLSGPYTCITLLCRIRLRIIQANLSWDAIANKAAEAKKKYKIATEELRGSFTPLVCSTDAALHHES